MSDNEIQLPPRREMPPEVRDRLRVDLRRNIDTEPSHNHRAPIAVAAGVAILAGGGLLVAQSAQGFNATGSAPTSSSTKPRPTFTASDENAKAGQHMDRCWEGIKKAGKTALFPDRSRWQSVIKTSSMGPAAKDPDQEFSAIRADGKPFFCETTPVKVTVSDPSAPPAYAAGTRTGALIMTPNGFVAGVQDPTWQNVAIGRAIGMYSFDTAKSREGLFVSRPLLRINQDTPIMVGPSANNQKPDAPRVLPHPASPVVSIVDNPKTVTGQQDLNTLAGRVLAACLTDPRHKVLDLETWRPGAMTKIGVNQQTGADIWGMIAHNGSHLALCEATVDGKTAEFYPYHDGELDRPMITLPVAKPTLFPDSPSMDNHGQPVGRVVSGVVPPQVARMALSVDETRFDAVIVDGTFVAEGPPGARTVKYTTFDAAGKLLHEGTLQR